VNEGDPVIAPGEQVPADPVEPATEPPQTPPAAEPAAAPDPYERGVAPHEKVCGNCRLYMPVMKNEMGLWHGDCRVMKDRGLIPVTAPPCGSFLARGAPVPKALKNVERPSRRPNVSPTVRPARPDVELPELADMTREELKDIIREALEETTEVRLAPRWEGGKIVIQAANASLQPKELPVDALFHKVVMLRDRLRVLEQKVNAHPKLTDAEKVEMQQYVTRCYGSLTSFNVLFADKEDQFVGEKGKGE